MSNEKKRVVILGGGFAGISAARSLLKKDVEITLVDRQNHHLFQPLLYQVATAGLSPSDIAAPIRSILGGHDNCEVILDEVLGVDQGERKVLTQTGSVPYDFLVVATGARHSYFGKDEWERVAPGLKSIPEATEIRRKILLAFERAERETDPVKRKAWLTFVLVGAGPTGVEMAGSIAELARFALKKDFKHINSSDTRVLLVEAGPRLLAQFSEELGQRAQKQLNKMGVEVMVGSRVESVSEDKAVISGQDILSKTIIWCAGVMASPAGQWLKVETDRIGRVKVGEDLTIPGSKSVFVLGDTACCMQDGKPLPGVAPVALQAGAYVAKVIAARLKDPEAKVKPFKYVNKGNLATVGRAFAVAEIGPLKVSGFMAWALWIVVHVYYLASFRNRASVVLSWVWACLTYQRGSRLITKPHQAAMSAAQLAEAREVKTGT